MMIIDQDGPPPSEQRDHCWSRIGSFGDTSCPLLQAVIHCHNCTVYSRAAQSFFRRRITQENQPAWPEHLQFDESELARKTSCLVFALGDLLCGLPTIVFNRVANARRIHRIPHRQEGVTLGLVNISGQVHPVFSLHALLQTKPKTDLPNHQHFARFVVIDWEQKEWVFPVDRLHGIVDLFEDQQISPEQLPEIHRLCATALYRQQNQTILRLDAKQLFQRLHQLLT